MHFTKLLIIALLLSGCVKEQTTTETIADSAKEQVMAIYNGLPKECQTDFNKKQTATAQKAIDAIVQSCNDQKEVITQEKIRWKWSFFGLLIVVGAYIAKRLTARW